jgi:hypothetical protein
MRLLVRSPERALIVFLLTAGLSASHVQAPKGAAEEPTEHEQWAADLDFLARELPAKHVNLFFKIKPQDFRAEVTALRAQIPKLKRPEFLAGLARLVASVGDAHTALRFLPQKAFPVKLYWFKEGICVTDTTPDFRDLLNGRLLTVGGHPVDEVVRAFSEIIPHDNEAELKDTIPRFLASSEYLLGLGLIDNPEEADFTVLTPQGTRASARMKSLALRGPITWAGAEPDPLRLPLCRRKTRLAYWFEYLAESRTVYFAYNSCQNMPGQPLGAFFQQLWAAIRQNPVDRLVVDLRNNGGGDSSLLDPFIDELAGEKEMNRKGRLFVVVGRRTFSSAILNALDLRRKTRALFYGEPTGGKPNHYGEIKSLALPSLKLTVSYSTRYFRSVDGDEPSFAPDVTVDLSLEDYLALRDPVLEAILAEGPAASSMR